MRTSKYISQIRDLPPGDHWVLVEDGSFYSTDDGYGGSSSHPYLTYIAFSKKEDWEEEIKRRMLDRGAATFVAFQVRRAEITTSVSVGIS